jgi:chemotaxis protein methyltransferase CheR
VLSRAISGLYSEDRLKTVSPQLRSAYFQCVEGKPARLYKVKDSLRKLVTFARLNLMEPWPMSGPFDVIFCRNVMIYFDKPTQGKLVARFKELLSKGGILMIGHSESLTGVKHGFRYVQPTIYEKP